MTEIDAKPRVGETQDDVEALLCLGLDGKNFWMPDSTPEERLRWAIPIAALMRIKPARTSCQAKP